MSDGEINVDSIDGEVLTTANIVGQLYPQGEKGDPGDPGQDGFSPIVTTEKVGKTTTITITDAEGEHTATILDGADGQGSGDMRTEVYDINQNGIVDDAEKVNGHTVGIDVPADAVFTDTTYTAGTGIDITGNVITNTQTSAEWGNITGTLSDQTDLKNVLDDKADASSLSSVATSGSYTDLSDKPSIPTKVSDLNNDSGFIDKDVNNLTNYDTSTTVDTKISNSEEVLIGSDSGIKASHELWVDPNDITPYVNSEISNDYGTAQNLGYSQEYVNDRFDGTKPMGDVVVGDVKGKNLLPSTGSVEQNGVKYTASDDGSVIANGTATAVSYQENVVILPSGTYTLSGCPSGGSNNSYKMMVMDKDYNSLGDDFGSGVTFTLNSETLVRARIRVANGYNINNVKFYPQIEQGNTKTNYSVYLQPLNKLSSTNNYSFNEIKIGTWINGKPLYRKVFIGTLTGETTNYNYAEFYLPTTIETLVRLNGSMKTNNSNAHWVKSLPANAIDINYFYNEGTGRTRLYGTNKTEMPITTTSYVVIAEYTKTTD